MIEKEVIEQAKRTDLAALAQAKGIDLKKNGKSLMGLCPFHADKNPSLSINTQKNLWQCFGCGAGGDPIRFVELFDQVKFKEAVARLTGSDNHLPRLSKKTPAKSRPVAKSLSIKDKKLLARVVKYYQHSLEEDKRGLDYLKKERHINDVQSIKELGAGYVNGTLAEILPDDPDVINQLKEIGILNAKGHECFFNCVVFPLFDGQGAVSGLYGRNIADNANVPHLYLAGPRTGILNRAAAKHCQSIFLTESVIDALTLYDRGFKEVVPIYGVNGFTDAHMKLFHKRIKTAYLVFDADPAGQRAADKVSSKLEEKGIECHSVTLPEKDANLYFRSHSPKQFEKLLKKAHPSTSRQSEKTSQDTYQPTDQGFIAGFEGRQYEIKGIQRGGTQLKAVVNASKQIGNPKIPFELTTIDLYSSRSRTYFAKLCADLFETDETVIKEDMGKLLSLVENHKPRTQTKKSTEPTRAERSAATKFLKSKDMFKQILADFETLGVTGERTNKLVGYLVAVSRKLDDPLSLLIQSRSAAGKSTLQDAVLSLVPDEDYVKYTRITDQALFYKEKDSLVHKILAIEEEVGMGGAAYSIRNIQSAKKITLAATGKDPATGEMKTQDREVNGPAAIMITTTAPDLEGETASRFIFLTVDDIDKANALAGPVLGQSLDELAPPSRTLLIAVFDMVKAMADKKKCPISEVYFTRRQIREYIGWSDWQVRAHIRQLEELEYLYARLGSKGKEYAYALNYKGQGEDDKRFYLNLTTVEQIKEKMKK